MMQGDAKTSSLSNVGFKLIHVYFVKILPQSKRIGHFCIAINTSSFFLLSIGK